ncbi:polysaccharide biosynthesis protein [Sulfitobacter sp. S190]|nr:polysaccharide biosynthesis protein [Sulfitobacter sp. S190]
MLGWIKSLTKSRKSRIMLGIDVVLLMLALLIALVGVNPSADLLDGIVQYLPALPYVLAAMIVTLKLTGATDIQVSTYDAAAIGLTAMVGMVIAGTSLVMSDLLGLLLPLSFHAFFGVIFFSLVVCSRAVILQIVLAIYRRSVSRCRVLIYGAGTTGAQLVSALRSHESIEPVAFVDDNKALQGMSVSRLPVYAPAKIAEVVESAKIDRVLLAVPSLSRPKQAKIAKRLEMMGLEVQMLPSFSQLIGDEALIDKLTPVAPRSFLGRAEVAHPLGDMRACYSGKSVLISGAGGSIGSELCRQVLDCQPSRLILLELSELGLYNIDMELRPLAEAAGLELVPVLGSATDARQVRRLLEKHEVQVVLHAAAYKHVPLVEANPLTGLVNNVFGTQTLGEQSAHAGVERFMLISSDKAVRPTNVMGASKRLAELVVHDLARRAKPGGTVFTMVRFGNVLGSSGSVIPLFQDQLSRGGPLTVTDPNVSRYFMTVQEAVQLVLQAGGLAKGGEVFVLDMGEPVSIMALARQVIEAAGYDVRDADNPDGDIEIEITGLRPGEKMTEELTLSGDLLGTKYPKIFATDEAGLSQIEIAGAMRMLREACVAHDEEMARQVVRRWVEGYGPQDTGGADVSAAESAS